MTTLIITTANSTVSRTSQPRDSHRSRFSTLRGETCRTSSRSWPRLITSSPRSLPATRLPFVRITACQNRSGEQATRAVARSSVSQISCCDFTRRNSHAPFWWDGIRLTSRHTAMRPSRLIRRDASLMKSCLINSICYRISSRRAGLPMPKPPDTRQTISSRPQRPLWNAEAESRSLRQAIVTAFSLPRKQRRFFIQFGPARWRASGRHTRERYGIDPKQVPDFIALRGDPSDGLPGAKGVGPKSAASLLRGYGSLENALRADRFPTQAADLRLYRRLATMDASAPIPALKDQTPTWTRASALAREWGLNQLAERLGRLA
jgi:hypothetical protein